MNSEEIDEWEEGPNLSATNAQNDRTRTILYNLGYILNRDPKL